MIIDERKVNLAEKDIEQWLWENPWSVCGQYGQRVTRWLKRQYGLPSGVADLIGITETEQLIVVEVKNAKIDASALAQVSRYAFDLSYIYTLVVRDVEPCGMGTPEVLKVVVGRAIDTQTLREAEALDVAISCFQVDLSLSVSSVEWSQEFRSQRRNVYDELRKDEVWEIAAAEAIESWKEQAKEGEVESEEVNP